MTVGVGVGNGVGILVGSSVVGSIVVGYLLDRVGLRWMFALNFAACAACYGLLANATSIELLGSLQASGGAGPPGPAGLRAHAFTS